MKIIYIVDSSDIGGAEKYLHLLAQGMADKGHRVTIAFRPSAILGQYFSDISGISIEILGPDAELAEILRRIMPDVVHFNLADVFGSSKIIECLPAARKYKLYATVHSLASSPAIRSSFGIKSWIAANLPFWQMIDDIRVKYIEYISRKSIHMRLMAFDGIIAVSKASKAELVEKYKLDPGRITVIYNGISKKDYPGRLSSRQKLGFGENVLIVACLGRLVKNKGQDIFIKAAKMAQNDLPEARFIICGNGYQKAYLQKLIIQNKMQDKIQLQGYDMADLVIGAMDISVVPSFSETFSFTVAESVAAGKPVIASQTGGIPELIENGRNGRLVKPKDDIDLARAIIEMQKDRRSMDTIGVAGKNISIKYPIEKMIHETEGLYVT